MHYDHRKHAEFIYFDFFFNNSFAHQNIKTYKSFKISDFICGLFMCVRMSNEHCVVARLPIQICQLPDLEIRKRILSFSRSTNYSE